MSRPDLHTPRHDNWDAGGYCNALVLDDEGCGEVCGYRKPDVVAAFREAYPDLPEDPHARQARAEAQAAETLTSNGHRWPCTRFYTSSSERDRCSCAPEAQAAAPLPEEPLRTGTCPRCAAHIDETDLS